MNSIPASILVRVIPSVLSAGGNPLSLNSVFLTHDTSIPTGTVQGFATLEDVQDWFGPSSVEATLAGIYFAGFVGATSLPSLLYFTQYNEAAVAGYLRSGSIEGLTLSQIQALSGTVTLTIDGVSTVSAAINLSGATSFTNAAALMQTGIRAGTPNNTATVVYDSLRHAFVVGSPTTGVASIIGFAAASTLATGVKLTAAAGAVQSLGADAAVPAAIMANVVDVTQNWVAFTTTWEPLLAGKQAFAAWVQTTNQRYAYIAWDSDVTPLAGVAVGSFGNIVAAAEMDGVFVIWDTDGKKAAFVCGTTASIDFTQPEGRITYAYKAQAGLVADITSATVANNLKLNGYNYYGAFATANDQFVNLQDGSIAGAWGWLDPYINQIWMNNELQLAYMVFLTQAKSVPYNAQGYSLLRAVGMAPIQAALTFGAIRPGVPLSPSQRAQVNTAAGADIAPTLEQVGFYLQIIPATPEQRAQRASPPMTLWYTDGGSIQRIQLASIDLQ